MKADTVNFGRHLWYLAVILGVVTSAPIALFSESMPWLISLPIIGGVLFMVVLSLMPQDQVPQSKSDVKRFLAKLIYAAPKKREHPVTKINYADMLLQTPEGYIPPNENNIAFKKLVTALQKPKIIFLIGEDGSGKKTMVQELCRKSEEIKAHSTLTKLPVYIPFSRILPRTNGVSSSCIDMISQYLEVENQIQPRVVAKQMVKDGLFCLIFADLEVLIESDHDDLQDFVNRSSKNSFVFVLNDKFKFKNNILTNIEKIQMPEWESDEARNYIARRISNSNTRDELIAFYEKTGGFERKRTANYWKYVANWACEEKIHEHFIPDGIDSMTEFDLLDGFYKKVLGEAGGYEAYLKIFGKLALDLFKAGRCDFTFDQIKNNGLNLQFHDLVNKLFGEYLKKDAFAMDNTQQLFFASKYLGSFWPEAKKELDTKDARPLIWTPIFSCTERFLPSEFLPELRYKFGNLYGIHIEDQPASNANN